MPDHSDILIVGASLAGFTTAEALRAEGFDGGITLVGDERHAPYSRPPLSKHLLAADGSFGETALRDLAQLNALELDLRLGNRATALDPLARTATVAGEALHYRTLVIATGLRARRPLRWARMRGIHTLRTIDDARAIRTALATGDDVAVVGTGLLGSELASTVRMHGSPVTLIGRARGFCGSRASALLSPTIERLHLEHGVGLSFGTGVDRAVGDRRVSALALSDRQTVPAATVIAAIGAVPAIDWLQGSGLDLTDGVMCDEYGRAARDVYAVGDVANWRSPAGTTNGRAEHQSNAIEQAQAVAHLIATGNPRREAIVPFFWSELYGTRLQACGWFPADADVIPFAGTPHEEPFVSVAVRDSQIVGVIGWNRPRDFRAARKLLSVPEPLLAEPSAS
jgi:NADPH-dependent 2,4-dienoyl-CoA reductase/sulfur reductase-like enzyme